MMQFADMKVAPPKFGDFQLQVYLCWTMLSSIKANSKLMLDALSDVGDG